MSSQNNNNLKNVTPATKAAVFLATIPQTIAVNIMQNLSLQTVEKLASEIKSLGVIDKDLQSSVRDEFSERFCAGLSSMGGESLAKKLITAAVPANDAESILEKIKTQKDAPFASLKNISNSEIARALSNEKNPTVAIILSYLNPQKVAQILMNFEESKRTEVILLLSENREADPEIVARIEEMFVQKIDPSTSNNNNSNNKQSTGPEFIAELLQSFDKTVEEEVMISVQTKSMELADQIRDLMFTFNDIAKLSDRDLQKVLREVQSETLAIALRGASPEVTDKFMNNLSKRAKEGIAEEMELLGKLKRSDVENEQKTIINSIRELEAAGEITISTGDDDAYI
ncbi:flagellar motor switch protein FliG [Lentisphaerota bacterium WC36G]|nr:flagellar motor switch protein FliG [Lentisphaerae bacterium WC36]